jgi:5-methylthioadenosine/S-adenosylhomocysteine deaminase
MGLRHRLPSLVNSHTHSPFGPHFNGVIRSQRFEPFIVDINSRALQPESPEEARDFALYTGWENLAAGNTAIVDQCYVPLTQEYLFAVAEAYQRLGLRAWVFTELADLPMSFYTQEAYPRFEGALPFAALPQKLQALCEPPQDYRDQLQALGRLIRAWPGGQVNIGVGISNPVWCSDDLLQGAAELAHSLQVPIEFHAEESPIQRKAHAAQWGMSAIRRAQQLGLLGPRTLLTHVVQVDDEDIARMASAGCSVSHNPCSNLKLHNGVAPIGAMREAGINVCLGSDGHSSGDTQSLFPAMKLVAALSELNGMAASLEGIEEIALEMAAENGRRLWFEGDFSRDYIALRPPIGPVGHVWDDPAPKIEEVYIDGEPRLAAAWQLVQQSGADARVEAAMRHLTSPSMEREARALAEWTEAIIADWRA